MVRFDDFGGNTRDLLDATSGGKFTPEIVAHALATKCRYTGHTRYPIWIAQHCFLGSMMADSPEDRLAFLLHEADEVLFPDFHGPLKAHIPLLEELAAPWEGRILADLGLAKLQPRLHSPLIKQIDERMLNTERRDACVKYDKSTWLSHPPFEFPILPWTWQEAEATWLREYDALRANGLML